MKIRDLATERLAQRFIRRILAPLMRAWFSTCRVEILGEDVFRRYVLSSQPIVAGTWHRAAIFFLYFFGNFKPMIMISRSKDGEMLAQYAAAQGVVPVRGSSNRGGRDALEQMRRHLLNGGKACATVLDGPRGPARRAKKGMLVLAKVSGAPLLLLAWSATRTVTWRHSWDRTVLPLPWSKVYLAAAGPIRIPRDCDGAELENYRRQVEQQLNLLTDKVDRLAGYRP